MGERRRRRRDARGLATAALLAALAVPVATLAAGAQSACAARRVPAGGHWSAPLDRLVSLRGREISLRDGLDRLAAAARIALSYSGDLLPLDRVVCLPADSMLAGDALSELLRGTSVEPVVTGSNQVVLAPVRHRVAADTADTAGTGKVSVLDRVVITGRAAGASERPLTVALDVVRGPQLEGRGAGTLAKAMDATVPGLWMWDQSASSLLARYGSIRGASSFGMSYPKIYIDGIEVANPLLVTQLNPESIDRVEVIRGPQGAALYGAGAISGVVNIVTRHDGADGERARFRTGGGVSESAFASHGALVQEQSVALNGGDDLRSAGLNVSVGSMGSFMPDAFSREVNANGALRVIGSRTSVTGTARFYARQAGVPTNPLVSGLVPPDSVNRRWIDDRALGARRVDSLGAPVAADTAPQSVREYTLGTTMTFTPDERWTHSIVAGVDGYRLANVPNEATPFPSAADSALRAARGGADRATLRLSSVARVGTPDRAAATVTLAAEHSALRETSASDDGPGVADGATSPMRTAWRASTGLIAQTDASLANALFVTGGLRLERDQGWDGASRLTTLPMFGAAVVRDLGPLTAKLRGAYGRGMRPAPTAAREITWLGMRRAAGANTLAPEEQAGVEGGADLLVGRVVGVHVTRFDQHAYGLIQPVSIADSLAAGGVAQHRMAYDLQNVGEIVNRGWELQTSASAGRLSVTGALSLVDSRVRRLAPGYSGDLRAGDRMLGVPARTASAVASWTGARWFTSWTLSRATDWTSYDRLALAQAWAGGASPRDLAGAQLRGYWRDYPGVTRLNATFSRDLTHGVSFLFTGDNLLDRQRGEPDNVTIVPGRTMTFGLRAAF